MTDSELKMTDNEIEEACMTKVAEVFSVSKGMLSGSDIFGEGLLRFRASYDHWLVREREIDYLIEPIDSTIYVHDIDIDKFKQVDTLDDYCEAMKIVYQYDRKYVEDFLNEKVNWKQFCPKHTFLQFVIMLATVGVIFYIYKKYFS